MKNKKPIGLDWVLLKRLCTEVLPMLILFGLVSCSDGTPTPETTVTPQTSTIESKEVVPATTKPVSMERDGTVIEKAEPEKHIIHTKDNKALSVDKTTYDKAQKGDSITTGTKP